MWQAIETAPMDGTRILLRTALADGAPRVDLGHWPTRKIFDQYADHEAGPIEPRWCEGDHSPLWRPVPHWQPLPSTDI